MKRIIIWIFIVLIGKFSFSQTEFSICYDSLTSRSGTIDIYQRAIDWENCIKGKQMPYLSFETIAGEKIETEKLKGKVLVINLWFIDCHPCIAELPALNRLVKEYKDRDVMFISLSQDTEKHLDEFFFPKYKFNFKIVPNASGIIFKEIGNTGFPTTYIIDKKGNVQAAWTGGPIDEKAETEAYVKAKPIIDELLKAE